VPFCRPPWSLAEARTSGSKAFFFEKKKQKTFAPLASGSYPLTRQALLEHLLFACLLAALSAIVVQFMIRVGTLDHPGARSSHTVPTPKGGGVGIVTAFAAGMLVLYAGADRARIPDLPFLGFLAAGFSIAGISYADDVFDWPFVIKLGAQLGAALVAMVCGIVFRVVHLPWLGAIDLGWFGWPLTAVWILFATNAVNFIDGLNGLASGSVGLACLFLAGIAWGQGDGFVFDSSLVLAAGIAGFLPFNFPQAQIFMGDVGSQFCGFTIAVLGVLAGRFGAPTLSILLVPALLSGVFFDVAFTLLRRLAAHENVTKPHRSHLYQVAQRSSMPAAKVVAIYWMMVIIGGLCCLTPGRPLWLIAAEQLAWIAYVSRKARTAGIIVW
jgi:UDP-GlcNAc:undecaprenyl-phosphate GlcNAc-1-phosphate transferase